MASAALGQELICSICLDLYTDPVTLRCGHNFCRVCIDQVLTTQDGSGVYSCPECRAEFRERPELQRNITLCNVVENFRSIHGADNIIFCSYCIHSPVPAAKSCLLCAASLCEKHLRVHSKEPEHVLTDPSRSLEKRKCLIHKKILEYYCTEDATCICVSCCLVGDHRGHNMESLDEASEKKKKKLKDVLQKLQTKRQKTQKKVKSLEKCRKKINEKQSGEAERLTALFLDLRRRLDDLEEKILSEISRRVEKESRSLTDVIQKLEIEKEELSRKMQDIEEMCNMTDPLTVLQEPEEPEERGDEDTGGHDGGDWRAELISGLSRTLSDIIRGINVTFYVQDPADISLDIDTAANSLRISDDLKTATWTRTMQNRPDTAERFLYYQVMSSSDITSGRHYWDVGVSGAEMWSVGVCYPSIDRRGDLSCIGDDYKSWGVYGGRLFENLCSVRHDSNNIRLPHQISSDRVRLYVDYEEGELSFYELCDPIRHLHTFTTRFTERLHAVLYVSEGSINISGGGARGRTRRM
ncbi:hypothetical protein GDO81_025124 [Engystomops pustulosus]|uniref:Uncharacterized protein n=1 Tax=Engystomops pustulosus TaxID=76066 RepID=A0AAV6Z4D0_ENGPU|nr:hypothetical protein GDO81_025124 [Engystomops pustulosus]